MVKNVPAWVQSLGQEDPLEKKMAALFSILAWKIPRREEPGGLQSAGSQRVKHDLAHRRAYVLKNIYFTVQGLSCGMWNI